MLFSVVVGVGCQQTKQDPDFTLPLLALLSQGIVFRYQTPVLTGGSQSSSQDPTQRKNMAGRAIADYGDGTGDGYTDRFLTPKLVQLTVSRVVGWKPVAEGGPALGTETEENATAVLFDCARDVRGSAGPCSLAITLGQGYGGQYLAHRLAASGARMDRIGIAISFILYQFDESVTDPQYRWVSMGRPGTTPRVLIRSAACGEYTGPVYGGTCQVRGLPVDGANGKLVYDGTIDFETKYPLPAVYASAIAQLSYEAPTDEPSDPGGRYYKVIPTGTASDGAATLYIDVDPTNVLFFDSNAGTNFDPSGDAPNGAGKEMRYHLPVMELSYQ